MTPALDRRAWLLPLAVAGVPFVAVHAALAISIGAGHVPSCVPYLEGCTSISRAARHGYANTLFQVLMLPAAAAHAVNWILARRWLAGRGVHAAAARLLPGLGGVAAAALAAYTLALGTEGDFYRWMRRFGIVFYFGCTYLAQLAFLSALAKAAPVADRTQQAMRAIALTLLLMGLASTAVTHAVPDAIFKDRIENVLEWHLGLLMSGWFALQAVLYRRHAG